MDIGLDVDARNLLDLVDNLGVIHIVLDKVVDH